MEKDSTAVYMYMTSDALQGPPANCFSLPSMKKGEFDTKSRVTCCTNPFKAADLNIIYLWKAPKIQIFFFGFDFYVQY